MTPPTDLTNVLASAAQAGVVGVISPVDLSGVFASAIRAGWLA